MWDKKTQKTSRKSYFLMFFRCFLFIIFDDFWMIVWWFCITFLLFCWPFLVVFFVDFMRFGAAFVAFHLFYFFAPRRAGWSTYSNLTPCCSNFYPNLRFSYLLFAAFFEQNICFFYSILAIFDDLLAPFSDIFRCFCDVFSLLLATCFHVLCVLFGTFWPPRKWC